MNAKESAKACKKIIASISRKGASFNADIQEGSLTCATHAQIHGDHTVLSQIVAAVQAKLGKRAAKFLIDYIKAFTPYNYDKEKEQFVKPRKTNRTFNLEGMANEVWHSYSEQKETMLNWDTLYQFDNYMSREEKKETKEVDKVKGDKAKAMARKAILQDALASLAKLDAPVKEVDKIMLKKFMAE